MKVTKQDQGPYDITATIGATVVTVTVKTKAEIKDALRAKFTALGGIPKGLVKLEIVPARRHIKLDGVTVETLRRPGKKH